MSRKMMVCSLVCALLIAPTLLFAGAIGGPKGTTERVQASSTDTYTVSFRAEETAWVYIDGDGDTDLDLYVYDENGNLIGSDTDNTDTCLVEWTPKWTGKFTIQVKNLGSVYNEYRIETN